MRKALLLLLLGNIFAIVQAQTFEFLHLDNTNGLSNNQVQCIFKDSRGFMWFATNSGLNRYDGTNFKIYKHIKNDPLSIPSDRFTGIQEDINANLWLHVNEDIYYVYNSSTEKFMTNIDSLLAEWQLPPSPAIIEIDGAKNLYMYYREKGIYKYNPQNKKITVYRQSLSDKNSFSTGEIEDIKIFGHYVWVLFRSGLLERWNENTGLVDLRNTYFEENRQNSTLSKSLFVDSENNPWIYPGIADKGAACFDLKTEKWDLLGKTQAIPLSTDFVRRIAEDKDGLIWIATDHGGINIIDKKKENITVLRNDIYNNSSIGQNSVISIFCDNEGIVWVGTYKNGLSYYHPNMFKFKKTPLHYYFSHDSETFDCNSLYKDQNQNLWIGTNGRGLVRYNEKTKDIRIFRHDMNNLSSISSDIITAILEDHAHKLWIGTFLGGLNVFDGNKFTRYQTNEKDKNSLSSKSIYGLKEDRSNNLWIGTLGGGVNKLDAQRKNFTRYDQSNTQNLLSNYLLSMSMDKDKNIYLSTAQGLNMIDKEGHIVPYFAQGLQQDSLTNLVINNTIVDSRGFVWIATDYGLNIYNPFTQRFMYVTTKEGIPSNEVVSMIEDNKGDIWAGTRSGLVCFRCKGDKNILEYSVTNFDENDGLPSSICNQNAIFKDSEGLIYVGTTKGYTCFDPAKIVFNTEVPKPRFTELLIANEIVRPDTKLGGRIILDRSITEINRLELNHDETNFTILFSSMNYIHPQRDHYKYMLEGLDKEWTLIKNGIGAASYSNLNPGTYKLIVYASNGDNLWSETPLVMEIVVRPPLWLTWWAFVIYTLIIAALLRLFLKFKLNKQKHEFEQTQQIMEANKLHEVDELKLRFFTNISHEFKTPLTLLLTPLEKLLQSDTTEEQKTLLNIMHRNAISLLNMVNEILDFRKLDLKKMNLNASVGDVISFVRDICQSFSSLASTKSIKLTFTTYINELRMEFDSEKLHKIISNLISNAFKFTNDNGQIDISISIIETLSEADTKQLCIKVSDTGIGIGNEFLDKIFDRFYRIENTQNSHQSGTGVGLHLVSEYVKLHNGQIFVESELEKGSTFTVILPMNNPDYKQEKIQDIIYTAISAEEEINPSTENNAEDKSNLPMLLIVDDNEDFRNFTKSLFTDSYRVITANDGVEAYDIVLDRLPDIILCDVMMPRMDGYELCRKIKEDIRTSHIPIILLTAKTSEENKYSGIEAGADDYIAKPFNINMLTLKIAKIIERQKKYHQNFKKKIDISPSEIQIMTMDEKFVKKAIALVEEHIGDPDFLVEDLGREMGMSRVYFYKKILALTDKSPSEFIRFIRLKRAADLLEKSQLFVNEIAFQVGFNDPKYFRKYFKEEFGLTPNDYKKKFTG